MRKLKLHEVGPTPIGANQATELLDVKAALETAAKSGRTLSKANEDRVKEIARLAGELLDSVAASDGTDTTSTSTTASEDEKAAPQAPPAVAAEPDGVKAAEQPAGPSPASLRLRADLEAMTAGVSLTD